MVFYHLSNKQSKQRNNQLVINGVGWQRSTLLFVKTLLFFCYLQGKHYLCAMAKITIKIKGIEALKEKLMEKKQTVDNALKMALPELGEKAVVFSKDNKGYMDRTANLKNSISFAVFHDGKQITKSIGEGYNATYKDRHNKEHNNPYTKGEVLQMRSSALDEYALRPGVVAPKGYTIIVVAGMVYGKYVEDKGYNVLYLTKYYLRNGIKDIYQMVFDLLKEK